MSERTRFLARLIGLYCVLAALLMSAQRTAMIAAVDALIHSAPLMLLLGVITVAAGLALILGHNIWSGGALPLIVTVIGWLTLLKGVLLWSLSGAAAAQFYSGTLHYAQLYYVYCAFLLALGVYLTAAGFTPRAR
jgi:vacuolar-type H+-ATPase subunit I/STV1